MKKSILLAFSVLMVIANAQAVFAGGGAHGGGGFICPDSNQSEFLDLWEGTTLHKPALAYTRKEDKVYDQIHVALDRLKEIDLNIWRVAKNRADRFYSDRNIFSAGLVESIDHNLAEIPFPQDALNILKKRGCEAVGIGKYVDADPSIGIMKDKLLVDFTTYIALPLTDQAAFVVHELIYLLVRKSTFTEDSRSTRAIVAQLFADNYNKDKLAGLVRTHLKYAATPFDTRKDKIYTGSNFRLVRIFAPGVSTNSKMLTLTSSSKDAKIKVTGINVVFPQETRDQRYQSIKPEYKVHGVDSNKVRIEIQDLPMELLDVDVMVEFDVTEGISEKTSALVASAEFDDIENQKTIFTVEKLKAYKASKGMWGGELVQPYCLYHPETPLFPEFPKQSSIMNCKDNSVRSWALFSIR